MNTELIDIAALYNASRPLGTEFMHLDPKPMMKEEAAEQASGSLERMVRLTVVGVTERHGQAWDLVCLADGIGTITVDPFVSCAWPAGTDEERRAMVGKEYMMANFQIAKDGCYLPETFCEPNGYHTEQNL